MSLIGTIKNLALTLAAFMLLAGCSSGKESAQVESYLDYLYKYMSEDDDLTHPVAWWENFVRKTIQTREMMGWDVPEHEFIHFVLPPEAFTDKLDDFRTTYADTLCRRVAGMSMEEAAIEVNFWCLEQATFGAPADSPMKTVELGTGTCTELSELLVCALRAVSIPARVVNVVWTYTSGSHSWVEAWIDGKWLYMGGAEPEPKINFGWFYRSASRVMLATINVFGSYYGREYVLGRSSSHTLISNLSKYAPVKNLIVSVEDTCGNALPGVLASFYVGKGEEKSSFYEKYSGNDGTVKLQTGYGDCAVVARLDSLYGVVKIAPQETSASVVLAMSAGEAESILKGMVLVAPEAKEVPGTPPGGDRCAEWEGHERVAAANAVRIAKRGK